jgi:hypothetical protein
VFQRGLEVSYSHSVIEIARNLHSYFYGVQSIGWDITVTPDGPIFIEGNDDWGGVPPLMFKRNRKNLKLTVRWPPEVLTRSNNRDTQ